MLLDLATRQDILDLTAAMQAVLKQAQQPTPADEPLWDVQRVAEYTGFDRKTVEKWVKEGQYNGGGKKVYLQAYKYLGRLRFRRADVEAFGLGIGVLTCTVAGAAPEPIKKPKKSKKPTTPVASESALRVA